MSHGHRVHRRKAFGTRERVVTENRRRGRSWDTPEGQTEETANHPNHGEVGSAFCSICNPEKS